MYKYIKGARLVNITGISTTSRDILSQNLIIKISYQLLTSQASVYFVVNFFMQVGGRVGLSKTTTPNIFIRFNVSLIISFFSGGKGASQKDKGFSLAQLLDAEMKRYL